jgi:hypothetical protein
MSIQFKSVEEALMALATPGTQEWSAAFAYLTHHPDTSQMMLETFQETLQQMGVAPTGTDPATGEPAYSLEDVARAMQISEADLDGSVTQARHGDDS